MTFSDILLKSFNENPKELTEITKTKFFCFLHENHMILNCFQRRYEWCMQKYPNKHIFVEFADKA